MEYSGALSIAGYSVIESSAVKAGSESDSLSFSGANVTVRLPVDARLNGRTVKVYRSDDSQATFSFVSDCKVASAICEFKTPGFSVFVPLEPADSVPDAFSFENVAGVLPDSDVLSKPVTIVGINVFTGATSTGGTMVVNGVASGNSANVNSGDTVSLLARSSGTTGQTVRATLTVGGVSANFSVTSGDAPAQASRGLSGGGGGAGGWPSSVMSASSSKTSAGSASSSTDDSDAGSASHKNFAVKDVNDHWSKPYVLNLVRLGIVNNSSKFRPDDSLTRAEFLKIALNAAEEDVSGASSDTPFSDVAKDAWYTPYVSTALKKGIISDKSDKFRPDDRITRAEVAKILASVLELLPSEGSENLGVFSDVAQDSEFAVPVSSLYGRGLFSGQLSGERRIFRPSDSITRAEIAKVTSIGFELADR